MAKKKKCDCKKKNFDIKTGKWICVICGKKHES